VAVETLGEALDQGWGLKVRCAFGRKDGLKSIPECIYRDMLHLPTLVWTRGREFPLSRLGERLKCPRCGSRRVFVLYEPPRQGHRANG
jgi:hypothetical protein